jgi:hypothetical protein
MDIALSILWLTTKVQRDISKRPLSYLTECSGTYWKLKDYLNVLNVLSADNYVYFTSDKSSIIELFEWLEANCMLRNPFSRAKTNTACQYMGRSGRYTDLMYYKNYKR